MFGKKRAMMCGVSIAAVILSGAAAVTLLASEKSMMPAWKKATQKMKKTVKQWMQAMR